MRFKNPTIESLGNTALVYEGNRVVGIITMFNEVQTQRLNLNEELQRLRKTTNELIAEIDALAEENSELTEMNTTLREEIKKARISALKDRERLIGQR